MGIYINLIIKANISSEANYKEKYQYAETCIPAFKQYMVENNPMHEDYISVQGAPKYSNIYIDISVMYLSLCHMII